MLRAQQVSQPPLPAPGLPALPPLPTTQTASSATGVINVESLGVSFDRIKRILGDRKPTADKNGLNLNYFVEVTAEAPPIQIFTKQDVAPTGPIPFGAPTHADIVDRLTPAEFKGGMVPVSALVILGLQKYFEAEANRAKREKMDADRKKQDDEERKRQQQAQDSGLIIKKIQ